MLRKHCVTIVPKNTGILSPHNTRATVTFEILSRTSLILTYLSYHIDLSSQQSGTRLTKLTEINDAPSCVAAQKPYVPRMNDYNSIVYLYQNHELYTIQSCSHNDLTNHVSVKKKAVKTRVKKYV